MRLKLLSISAALLVAVCGASAAGPVRVALTASPPAPSVGQPWTAKLSVRPSSFGGPVRVLATGPGRLDVRATGSKGAYRARLVFPSSGRWKLTARAGGSTSQLGSVTVRGRAPLAFAWPTSVALQPDGSLLVVEKRRGNGLRRRHRRGGKDRPRHARREGLDDPDRLTR